MNRGLQEGNSIIIKPIDKVSCVYSLLVIADVVGLYPSIPHANGLKALKEAPGGGKKKLNNFDSSLKLTHETLKEKVNFLVLTVSLESIRFTTDLFWKSPDCHQYLELSSCHLVQTKRSMVYSQRLHIKHFCSSDEKSN